jgi:hypothetical protein
MWRFTRNNGITAGFRNKMELINRPPAQSRGLLDMDRGRDWRSFEYFCLTFSKYFYFAASRDCFWKAMASADSGAESGMAVR